jgi:hypothetical protein
MVRSGRKSNPEQPTVLHDMTCVGMGGTYGGV